MPAQLSSKRAWLLLAASVTLHIFLLANTRHIGDKTGTTPTKRLLKRWSIDEPVPAVSSFDLPYSDWYDNLPGALKPFYIVFLLLVLAFLFSFIGISASDFFCPNLATIAAYLGLNESTAGVTFLAFGNGSPDVFSTFSAMKNETVGLAIGELLGAATFITSIVVGSIAFIKPFHVPKHAFMRDVLFFTSAVLLLVIVLKDGHLALYEAGSMVILYLAYVLVVVGGNWWAKRRKKRKSYDNISHHHITNNENNNKSPLLDGSHRSRRSSTYSSPHLSPIPQPLNIDGEVDDNTLNQTPGEMTPVSRPHLGRMRSHTSASYLNANHPHLHHHDSIDTPRATFSLLGAVEFRDVVNSLRKESSSRLNSPGRSPNEREQTDYFGPTATSTVGHRRSSSYGFSAAFAANNNGTLPRRTTSTRGRRRASTHSSPTDLAENSSRSVSAPGPYLKTQLSTSTTTAESPSDVTVSSEPNPWEDQQGNPPTPQPPSTLTVPGTSKPSRPKVIIPQSERRVHLSKPSIPSIAVVDPSGRTDDIQEVEEASTSSPPQTPPLKFIKKKESRFAIRRKSKLILRVLFPSLQSFRHKSWLGMILAITSVPAILVLTLTLPVVDDGSNNDCDHAHTNEGGIQLPTDENEPLNDDPELGISEEGYEDTERDDDEDEQANMMEEESNRLLNPEIGEELHHLVDHGFSPLHSPLGRISHSSLRRLNSHLESAETDELENQSEERMTKEEEEALYEEMQEERGLEFNKWLTATQCILGPAFCVFVTFSEQSYFLWVFIAALIGGSISAIATLYYAKDGSSYTWRLVRCFCGFTCSMVWIAAIADEVVDVLGTVGEILGLSDAIIGLTIFAVGNSLADLVANVTVAQFAPAMAYAACFGGPMLNLLLGVGGSGTYHILFTPQHKPVTVHFSPTLWVSAAGLILILITTAIVVPLNNYLIDRRWAICLIIAYITLMIVNVAVEIKTGRS
ncbi:uncharacterized protein L201_007104 [Kwoniella dendrophila CBS 6074]|uniref:Sodium/calcium exchanger membrane region domain-containing protein n=1 Tax=Kwoniella dendrophila CBS 6074 TaxID=1295534 RepID=A0AAX4K5T9_9TREE